MHSLELERKWLFKKNKRNNFKKKEKRCKVKKKKLDWYLQGKCLPNIDAKTDQGYGEKWNKLGKSKPTKHGKNKCRDQ